MRLGTDAGHVLQVVDNCPRWVKSLLSPDLYRMSRDARAPTLSLSSTAGRGKKKHFVLAKRFSKFKSLISTEGPDLLKFSTHRGPCKANIVNWSKSPVVEIFHVIVRINDFCQWWRNNCPYNNTSTENIVQNSLFVWLSEIGANGPPVVGTFINFCSDTLQSRVASGISWGENLNKVIVVWQCSRLFLKTNVHESC